jgi:predicted TIM-barrel fold metal-dependent hydrolase
MTSRSASAGAPTAMGGPAGRSLPVKRTMKAWNRREWLAVTSGGLMVPALGSSGDAPPQAQGPARPGALALDQFQPASMLRVPVNRVERPRFPVIDVHTHLSWSGRAGATPQDAQAVTVLAPAQEVLSVMDRKGVKLMVNLTGGRGTGLERTIREFQQAHPGRFLMFTEPWWPRAHEPAYPQFQAGEIEKAARAGARGVKVLKTLGLYLRDGGPNGRLVTIDDRRFDPMWEACAALNLPVAIHIADPVAFFRPTDRFNERYEELHHHPDWSFHGRDFPTFEALIEARNRVFARHPRTTWIALHVGHHAEDLAEVAASLDRFPNMHVELGARIGELGRQPRASRRFFERYQDRILFGTDAVPHGKETPQQLFGNELYEIYYRFLETEDEYFDYAPAPVPPQGRWRIYGLGLPDAVLKKVYHDNAARLLRVEA